MTEARWLPLSPGIDPARLTVTVSAGKKSYGLSDTQTGTKTWCYIGGKDAATQANGGTVFALGQPPVLRTRLIVRLSPMRRGAGNRAPHSFSSTPRPHCR